MNGTAASPGRERLRADDAGGDRVVEAERRPDGDDPFTDLRLIRIADPDGRQPSRVDLDDGDVGRLVLAQHLRLELALVGQADQHLVGVVDHVRIGDDHSAGIDNEARARAHRRHRVPRPWRVEEATELRRDLVLVHVGSALHRCLARLVRDGDLDYRRSLLRDQLAEVGQRDGAGRGTALAVATGAAAPAVLMVAARPRSPSRRRTRRRRRERLRSA
jgi:hypothetical protein